MSAPVWPGLGVDIELSSRFRGKGRGSRMLARLFTRRELDYCFSKHAPAQHLAARFAAKEAVLKALFSCGAAGSGSAPSYEEIEIISAAGRCPIAKINKPGLRNVIMRVSLSHSNGMALAAAIASGRARGDDR